MAELAAFRFAFRQLAKLLALDPRCRRKAVLLLARHIHMERMVAIHGDRLVDEALHGLHEDTLLRRNKRNAQVEHLAKKAIEKIRASSTSGKSKREMALLNFLGSMRSDLRGMARAVSDYSFAFAATCQQSVNDTMQRQKGVGGLGSRFEYDYVIVDEAARVSPRDLLIPMVQGRHVILVGDHRQLPHIIDDEVARCFESGEKEEAELILWMTI